ncbi:MAG TPA: hypothetical protein VGN54_07680 [Mycobacteriales bacterium]|jgi:hypothetical protein|nr:hypothetical protein [Mycobacteriales bacterium]
MQQLPGAAPSQGAGAHGSLAPTGRRSRPAEDLERATYDEIDLLAELMITAAGSGRPLAQAELDRALGLA